MVASFAPQRVEMDHSMLDELSAPGIANSGLPFGRLVFVEFQVPLQSLECLQWREPGWRRFFRGLQDGKQTLASFRQPGRIARHDTPVVDLDFDR